MKLHKKFGLCLFAAAAMLLCLLALPQTAHAASESDYVVPDCEETASGTCGEKLAWTLYEDGTLHISGSGAMTNYTKNTMPWYEHLDSIQTVVVDLGVTTISNYAFYNCTNLTSITIPDSVTSIGNAAFRLCKNLISVTVPDSVISIGNEAFRLCAGLTSINIPDSVTSIGWSAFYGCEGLTRIEIPDSVTSIGNYAFYDCTGLTNINIPGSITTISDYVFAGCSGLSHITIPAGVDTVGEGAFAYCYGLTGVTIPNSVTNIGDSVFWDCPGLATVIYCGTNEQWTAIEKGSYNDSLTNATLQFHKYENNTCIICNQCDVSVLTFALNSAGDGYIVSGCDEAASGELVIPAICNGLPVTSIGDYAFRDCYNLTSITIPNSVTSIGIKAFACCTGLTSVTIPDSVSVIGQEAFDGCRSLTSITIPNGVSSIVYGVFQGCVSLNNITIPDSVTRIGKDAFKYCRSLTSITIPNSITAIGDYAFNYCDNLTGIWVDENNAYYSSDSYGVLFNKDQTELIRAPQKLSGSYSVPESVKSIDGYAFMNCTSLTNITVPDSVTTIGDGLFEECNELVSATLGNGISRIKYRMFYGCTNLASITIPNSVTSIGDQALRNCTSLTSITIPDSVTSVGYNAFNGCSNLINVVYCGTQEQWDTIEVGDSNEPLTNASLRFHNYANNTCIICNQCNISVLTFALNGAGDGYIVSKCDESATGELVIPATYNGLPVTDIRNIAFYGCTGLTSISIPDSITSIGNGAFFNCAGLTSITIPNSVTSISQHAFAMCSGLTSFTIPKNVTSIGEAAFYGCKGLTDFLVESGNTKYHSDGNCIIETASKTLVAGCRTSQIPTDGSVTKIGNYAFYYSNLSEVIIPDSVTVLGRAAFSNCRSLTSITIPDQVTTIGESAFSNCAFLAKATIGAGVKTIGQNAFTGCYNLKSVNIPDSVTKLGDYAFRECSRLTNVTIGARVTTIGKYAFLDCTGLTSIAIPSRVTSIGSYAFKDCTNLESVIYCGTQEQWDAITMGEYNEPLTNATLQFHNYENCVCTVCGATAHTWVEATCTAPKTCSACGATEGSALGHDMQEISAEVPADCENEGKTAVYTCANGCGKTEGGEEIPALGHSFENGICTLCGEIGIAASGTCGDNVTWELFGDGTLIIDGTGKMKDYYFHFMNQYEPDPAPWYDIRALVKNVIIQSGVTRIGNYAFYACNNLESITIPASIESIGMCAFTGCKNMLAVYITDLTAWCNIDFEYYTFPEGSAGPSAHPLKWGGKLYLNGEEVKDLVIPDGITTIKDYTFYFGSFNSITIPSSVQTIGTQAFYECNMKSIVIPNSVTNIGASAFGDCGGLTNVTYCGTQTQWNAIVKGSNNDPLLNATLQFHNFENGICTICGQKELAAGDIDGNDEVTYDDAVYLLLHTMFGEELYPLNGAEGDINGNGTVDGDDAVYLLLHTLFGDAFYPLNTPALPSSKEELIG